MGDARTSEGNAGTRLLHVTTVPLTLRFLRGQLRELRGSRFEPHVASAPGDAGELEDFATREAVPAHAVPMTRTVSPVADVGSLWSLWSTVRRVSPTIVHAHTPKAGLLSMLAASSTATPIRVYHMRGLPLRTASGATKLVLRWSEKISCALAHRVFCVSHSLREIALEENLCPPGKLKVLGSGSGQGVDALDHFRPSRLSAQEKARVRAGIGIPAESPVVGFVGRLVGDKGVAVLAHAWQGLRQEFPDAHLVLVGPEEVRDPVAPEILNALRNDDRVHVLGFVEDPAPLYAIMDVVALPTEREGFPNVPLEAGAMEIPVVASRVTGCVDAVMDRRTGRLVAPGDADALRSALAEYVRDPALRAAHGSASRARILEDFEAGVVTKRIHERYDVLLRAVPRLRRRRRKAGLVCKRAVDLLGAIAGLLVLSPVLAMVALLVRTKLGSPILFRQDRPGKDGEIFTLLKFRTMSDARDAKGNLLPDDQRLGRFGQLLRRTSLDELPELWNVVRGEMSLVGPRPLLIQYLERYSAEQARRHELKPGITGWSAVNGRNAPSWETKLAMDVWYVDHWSLLLDVRILLRTVATLVRREGIEHGEHVTMPEFQGSPGGSL